MKMKKKKVANWKLWLYNRSTRFWVITDIVVWSGVLGLIVFSIVS